MWKELVASVTPGLHLLREGIYNIQSSYFCNKLYFEPNVTLCLLCERKDNVLHFGILTVDSCPSPPPNFLLESCLVKCIIFKDVIQWMARCGCRYKCFHFRGEFYSVVSFFVITTNIFTSTINKSDFN